MAAAGVRRRHLVGTPMRRVRSVLEKKFWYDENRTAATREPVYEPQSVDDEAQPDRGDVMKRNGPLITLLVGIGVAAVLFLLSMQATRTGNAAERPPVVAGQQASASLEPAVAGAVPQDAQIAPAPASEAPTANAGAASKVDKQPLAQPATPDGTWAGYLKLGTLALSIKDGKAIAYFCDGKKAEAWLKGTVQNGRLDLTGKKGATLAGTVDQNHAKGKVTVGGRPSSFDVDAVSKPSGLYRAAADVRGAKIVGGWIVLKDGTQVGLATVGEQVTKPSELDVTTGRATVDGTTVTAAPADPTR
jgi:serine/threonine-protein kinase